MPDKWDNIADLDAEQTKKQSAWDKFVSALNPAHRLAQAAHGIGEGLASAPGLASDFTNNILVNPQQSIIRAANGGGLGSIARDITSGTLNTPGAAATAEVFNKAIPQPTVEDTADKYIHAAGTGVGTVAAFGPEGGVRALPRILAAGAGGGMGQEAASEQYPGNPIAQMAGMLVGALAGERVAGRVIPEETIAPRVDRQKMTNITAWMESRNNPNAVNPRSGASGIMQVMRDTARDPGHGIKPSDGTPEDTARVGRELLGKLMDKYQDDPEKAWAAYNWGEGHVDRAIGKYGDDWLEHAPQETRDYVNQGTAMLGDRPMVGSSVPSISPEVMARAMGDAEAGGAMPAAPEGEAAQKAVDLTNAEAANEPDLSKASETPAPEAEPAAKPQIPEEPTGPSIGQMEMEEPAPEAPIIEGPSPEEMGISNPMGGVGNYEAMYGQDMPEVTPESVKSPLENIAPPEPRPESPLAEGEEPQPQPQAEPQIAKLDPSEEPTPEELNLNQAPDEIPAEPAPEPQPEPQPPEDETQIEPPESPEQAPPISDELPPEPPSPPGGGGGGPEGPESEGPIDEPALLNKFKSVLRTASNNFEDTAALRTQDRIQRLARFQDVSDSLHGMEGARAGMSELKGEYDTPEGIDISNKFSDRELNHIAEMIKKNTQYWERARAFSGLNKLLNAKPLTPSEIEALKKVFPKDVINAMKKSPTLIQRILNIAHGLLGIPRGLKLIGDVGVAFRQAVPLIGTKEYWKAIPEIFKGATPFAGEKMWQKSQQEIMSRENWTNGMYQQGGVAFSKLGDVLKDREEFAASKLAEHIPGVRMSERGFTGFLNKIRADLFDRLFQAAPKWGINPYDPKYTKALGDFVNVMTGRGSLGEVGDRAAPFLASVFFSPRLMASRLRLFNPLFYARLPNQLKVEAAKSLVSYSLYLGSILGIAKWLGYKVGNDPKSADYGRVIIDKTRYDFSGGFQPYVRLAAQEYTGQKTGVNGNTIDLGSKFGAPTRLDVLISFLESKGSPNFSLLADELRGKDLAHPKEITGNIEDWNKAGQASLQNPLVNAAMPMPLEGYVNAASVSGPRSANAAAAGLLEPLGISANTYTETPHSSSKSTNFWQNVAGYDTPKTGRSRNFWANVAK